MPVFPDITKVADFWWKYGDFSRTQDVCFVVYVFSGPSLGKIQLCQVCTVQCMIKTPLTFKKNVCAQRD